MSCVVPGRFGFVEMRTEELASSAMALDKVELCGRNINVGRPKGYVEPPQVSATPYLYAWMVT
jgi:splicing factor U2AF subunit